MKILLCILSLSAFINCFAQDNYYKYNQKTVSYKQTKTFDNNDVHFNTNTEKGKKYDRGIKLSGFYWHKIFSLSPTYYLERKRHAFDFGVQSYFNLAGYYELGPIIGYKNYLTNNKKAYDFYLIPVKASQKIVAIKNRK